MYPVANQLVTRSVRIVSAAWCVICSGSRSTDGSSANGSGAYRHSRGYTPTIIASTVNPTAIYTAAIYTAVINANSSSIIRGGVT